MRKKQTEQREQQGALVSETPQPVTAPAAPHTEQITALLTWLSAIQCTAPFTVADARALYDGIHSMLIGAKPVVDVYVSGQQVHVRVDHGNDCIERVFDVI